MPVTELLSRTTSYELAEWQAFERAYGPLGREYISDALASIHEQLQILNRMTGEQFEDNPAAEPSKWPRPNDIFKPVKEDEGDSPGDFDANFNKR